MIETQARVTSVEPGFAWIESERRSGCSHCGSSGSCGVSSLSKLFGVQRVQMRLPDSLGVSPGEDIVIGLSERRLVGAAAMIYMVPLLLMIAAALAGVHLQQGQVAVAMLSLAGLVAGLWLARCRADNAEMVQRYSPVMLKKGTADACRTDTEHVLEKE